MFGIKKLKAEIVELRQEMQDLRDLTDDNHNEQWDLLRQVHIGVNSNISDLADQLRSHILSTVVCDGCGCLVDEKMAVIHVIFADITKKDADIVLTHYCKRCAGEMEKKTKKEKTK
jgi:hypothetical protein